MAVPVSTKRATIAIALDTIFRIVIELTLPTIDRNCAAALADATVQRQRS
jgi:hypothetical protein